MAWLVHAARAAEFVHQALCAVHFLVGQEPIGGVVSRRARENADLGIAVEVDFFQEVGELQLLKRCLVIAVLLRHPFLHAVIPETYQAFEREALVDEVQLVVEDELIAKRRRALFGPRGIGGFGS